MTEEEFSNRFIQEAPMFAAWGLFVQDYIISTLEKSVDIKMFLKVPPQEPRIKSLDSLITKAFHRNKNYSSPYDDITDKVGIRFIVLLTTDTTKIGEIIEEQNDVLWNASKDKDYEEQRKENPEHFTYESLHYVVCNIKEVNYNGINIPSGIPCEIQIRTLLQHAYAEMTHDTIYKPQVKTVPSVKRYMARSMALVESADHFFIQAMKEIDQLSQQHKKWAQLCEEYYPLHNDHKIDDNANTYLIDSLIELLKDTPSDNVKMYLETNKALFNAAIFKNVEISWIYRQPAVLLVYYLIANKNTVLQRKWPLTSDMLSPLLRDLGVAPLTSG